MRYYVEKKIVFDAKKEVGRRVIATCLDIETAEKIANYFNWLELEKDE